MKTGSVRRLVFSAADAYRGQTYAKKYRYIHVAAPRVVGAPLYLLRFILSRFEGQSPLYLRFSF